MIKEIKGDLIRSAKNGEFDLIAHQANCFNTMGSGIAKSIKEEWPEAAAVDSATIKGDRSKLGTISFTTNTNPIIVNLYGQFDYWSPGVLTDYDALEKALLKMKETFPSKKIGMGR
jgi:O-acetyl-ADP-ribose deacetylase (regulator of RNase III)